MKKRLHSKEPNNLDPVKSVGPKEIAFSVRLTADEHEILRQAAERRGWTPTNLIRTATLERARHILNTSRVTAFNFKGLAVRIADQLFKPRTYDVRLADEHSTSTVQMSAERLQDLGPKPEYDDNSIVTAVVPRESEFPLEVLQDLRNASKYGGGEFLNLILDYCEVVTAPKRTDLPPPLEPLS